MTKNQIDFILSSDRKIVRNCEGITKVDIGSDHRMVRARAERDKKVNETKKNRVLEKLATPFRTELKNRFDTLKDEEPSIEENEHSPERIYGHHTKPKAKVHNQEEY